MYSCLNPQTKVKIAEKVNIGNNVIFGYNCNNIEIGYGSFLGDDLYIDVPLLTIGEYTTVHRGVTIHGYKPCQIGHNCWIGQFSIIDSIGGTKIGNNVGIGAQSQLWSHIKFGDTMEGCLWNKEKKLTIDDDVWFVGHCIVNPIHAKQKSMLMVGGVVTKDMEENRIYAGIPAKDVTKYLGNQFKDINITEKKAKFEKYYNEFIYKINITKFDYMAEIVDVYENLKREGRITYFNISERTYLPSRSENEYAFMKYLLYDKAKFIPVYNTALEQD